MAVSTSTAPGYQRDALTISERGVEAPSLPGSFDGWTWISPIYPTNSTTSTTSTTSTVEPGPRSGLIPGLIAATIFIVFLLCLYAILWKCMVSQSHRHAKRQQRKRSTRSSLPHKSLCAV